MVDETEYLLRSQKNAQRLAKAILELEDSRAKTKRHTRMSHSQRRLLVRLARPDPKEMV
jgi:hypothetical protein